MKIITTDLPHSVLIEEANKDYLLARFLWGCCLAFHNISAYHSHQAIEKYIKAFLIQKTKTYPPIHDLIKLCEIAKDHDAYFSKKETINLMLVFNAFKEVTRYGAESMENGTHSKNEFLEMRGKSLFSTGHIKKLDRIIFEIRKLLVLNPSDSLKAILGNDNKNIVVATWEFKNIPLRKVLVHLNDYFK